MPPCHRHMAIECFLGCLGQPTPTHWRRLVMNHAHWGLSLRFPTLHKGEVGIPLATSYQTSRHGTVCNCSHGSTRSITLCFMVDTRTLTHSEFFDMTAIWTFMRSYPAAHGTGQHQRLVPAMYFLCANPLIQRGSSAVAEDQEGTTVLPLHE